MLEFIYCGDITLNDCLVLDLYTAACKYAIPTLKAVCEQHLISTLTLHNVIDRVKLAEQTDAATLRKGTLSFLISNSSKLTQDLHLESLPKKFLVELISGMKGKAVVPNNDEPKKLKKLVDHSNGKDSSFKETN